MFIKATEQDKSDILKCLEPHVEQCIYLYLDLYWYGVENDNVDLWYEKEGEEYTIIVLRYFDCFQIYSPNDEFQVENLLELEKQFPINRLFARKSTIDYIAPYFAEEYFTEYGKVIEFVKHRDFGEKYQMVEEATREDLPELVALLLTDEENALSYTYDELLNSLTELYDTNMGKSFIIKDDGKIVATVSISAQSDIFIIGAYTMVHKDYRNTLYGMIVDSYLINVARGDRRHFGFVMDPRRIRMFESVGNKVVAEYGKLIKK